MASLNYETVATYTTPFEAHIVANHLEDFGIKTYVADEAIVDMAWHLGVAVGGVKAQVMLEDVAAAQDILGQLGSSTLDEAGGIAEGVETASVEQGEELPLQDAIGDSVDRALRAAAFGVLFFPLQFYSIYLMVRLLMEAGSLDFGDKLKLAFAALLNCCVLLLIGLYASSFYQDPIQIYLSNGEQAVPINLGNN